MVGHQHFLARIQAADDPREPQGIYADWLEEQGDPRAELLRLAVAVRSHTPPGIETDDARPINEMRRHLIGVNTQWMEYARIPAFSGPCSWYERTWYASHQE